MQGCPQAPVLQIGGGASELQSLIEEEE